jgi:hypothetical protein
MKTIFIFLILVSVVALPMLTPGQSSAVKGQSLSQLIESARNDPVKANLDAAWSAAISLPQHPKSTEGWSENIKKLEAILAIIAVAESNYDPRYSTGKPTLNVPVPSNIGIEAGSDPSAIKDPALRTKYEAAITANKLKIERYKYQSQLEQFIQHGKAYFETYVKSAFTANEYAQVGVITAKFLGADKAKTYHECPVN